MIQLGAIPETLEIKPGECLEARTDCLHTFRSLGPPDLVQLTKVAKTKESSTYHYLSGLDVSSSASIAAHLNTLTFSLGETQTWFGKTPGWKIVSGTYCTWNAFSRVDVRVNAKIPGSVDAYVLDIRGDKMRVTDEIWLEVYMSAMVRALILVDSDVYIVPCSRHDDPLPTKASVTAFYAAFERLFTKGPLLGATPQVVPAMMDRNFMVDAFFQVVNLTRTYKQAKEVLLRLKEKHAEARPLLGRVELLANDETSAIREIVASVNDDPRDMHSLVLEADFCVKKGAIDLALDCALRATTAGPGEFFTWEALAKVYIAREDYDQALLALNSCPIIPSPPIDAHRMPPSKRTHTPLPDDGVIDEIWDADPVQDTESADPTLLRLPGGGLRGSSKSAYALLADILNKIGWSQLLLHRADVFLMAVEANEPTSTGEEVSGEQKQDEDDVDKIPEQEETNGKQKGEESAGVKETLDSNLDASGELSSAAPADLVKPESNGSHLTAASTDLQQRRSIRSKRLCEKRFDMLFIVIFEDVRAHSNWQREAVHFESQQLPYVKTALEWEILGAVAQRLGHYDQALDALDRSLALKFSHRPVRMILEILTRDNQIRDIPVTLDCVVKLMAWNHRWYIEFSPYLNRTLADIVALDGLTKVRNRLEAAYSKTDVLRLLDIELAKLREFDMPGTEL